VICRNNRGYANEKIAAVESITTSLQAANSTSLFYPKLAAYNTQENPGKLHPDPHPQFVCNDKYIISTVNLSNGHMDLSITPVAQLIGKTE
jgi:hypothetical protein